MSQTREYRLLDGPAGPLEVVLERPHEAPRGLALIAHPHPLFGGTMDNKVVTTLARAALGAEQLAVRSNFRGVGASGGSYADGYGECEDLAFIARRVSEEYPDLPWTLLGFSFGAFVQQQLSQRLAVRQVILVAPAVVLRPFGPVAAPCTILQGDRDEIIPLAAVQSYAEHQQIPLHIIPGAGHFFHGKLLELRAATQSVLAANPSVA